MKTFTPRPGLHIPLLLAAMLLGLLAWRSARAPAPAWQLALAVGSTTAVVQTLATDAGGNVYLAGSFQDTLRLGRTCLTSAGGLDVFVAKWNAASQRFDWAQRAGGPADDYAQALAIGAEGLFVTGDFTSATADFGPIALSNAGAAGSSDVFVAKLTTTKATAHFVWARAAGGAGGDHATALAVNGPNVYVAGGFKSPAIEAGETVLTDAGGGDIFVLKLADAGRASRVVWAQRAGGTDFDEAQAIAVSGASVYVAGCCYSAAARFGRTTLVNATSNGSADAFVAKLADAGPSARFVWTQRAGGTKDDVAKALAVSGSDVYVAGSFYSTSADFGPTTLASAGSADAFVAKLSDADSAASFVWAQRAGGPQKAQANALAVSGATVYVAGTYCEAADFGGVRLTDTGGQALFVAGLASSTGQFGWAQGASGQSCGYAKALALAGSRVYVAGTTTSVAHFGRQVISPAPASSGAFLAVLAEPSAAALLPAAGPIGLRLAARATSASEAN